MENSKEKVRKKGGLKAAFQEFVAKFISYLEVMGIYIQKNLQVYVRNLVLSSVWIFSALFFILIALGYFSFGIFLSIQKYFLSGDPILSSFLTAGIFLLFAIFFVELVLKKK
ncbi:hypothetical protein P3G55_10700 [Leptospira sp. 96542]|nr:hypothetical protein [Leptospira sp. 96542]